MSKGRLAAGTALVLVTATVAAMLAAGAGARPVQANGAVKLGFITKFPVDFYDTMVDAVKKYDTEVWLPG